MRKGLARILILVAVVALFAAGCSSSSTETTAAGGTETTSAGGSDTTGAVQEPVTITVWDYYGESSPIPEIIPDFEAANPNITVKVESLDWDTMLEKLNVVLTGGTPPDVITLDMTWLPSFAPLGAFADLNELSGGQLNGQPVADAYSAGALKAMQYGDETLAMLYDFDVYALYYRADVFDEMGLDVPTTWDELNDVAAKLSADGKYQYAYMADTFHGAQWIYENGGSLLNADNTKAAFAEPEAVEAIEQYAGMLDAGTAYWWSADEGWEVTPGLKDDRIAMFSDGAYYMGIIKDAAPEMEGKWRVAPHPQSKQPGSYQGGTGLVIPKASENHEASWTFIEYLMQLDNQVKLFEISGAAPALTAALEDPRVDAEDPYFGGQKTLEVFKQAMETSTPFPYVREWTSIDEIFTLAMEEIAIGDKDVATALSDAAASVDETLGG
jgi:multiple sugar transport system substrate-binding protein